MKVLLFFFPFLMIFVGCTSGFRQSRNGVRDSIPSVDVLLLDSTTVLNTRSFADSASTVLIFFAPYCEFCQKEIKSIVGDIKRFKNTQFILLTIPPMKDVKEFCSSLGLNRYPNIHIGIDTSYAYAKFFNTTKVPHTSVYTRNRMISVFTSSIEANKLHEVIY